MRGRIALALLCVAVAANVGAEVPVPGAADRSDAGADGQWRQDGKPVADEPWRRSVGEFGAMLFLTDRPEEFFEQWDRPAAPGYVPSIHPVDEVRRGDVVAAVVLFKRCTADALGSCRSHVEFQVLRPDGSVYGEHRATLWNAPPPPLQSLQRANDHLMFRIEPADPLGTYQIRAVVRDQVAKREVTLLRELRVRGD